MLLYFPELDRQDVQTRWASGWHDFFYIDIFYLSIFFIWNDLYRRQDSEKMFSWCSNVTKKQKEYPGSAVSPRSRTLVDVKATEETEHD